jgi:regulator of sigma E protease
MNFILAWFLITVGLVMGVPGDFVSLIDPAAKIKISGVMPGSPAEQVGLKSGDEILKEQGGTKLLNTNDLITYINAKKGEQIDLRIIRGGEVSDIKVIPRADPPEDQGPLGINFDNQIQKYPWYDALWKGLVGVISLSWLMVSTLFSLLGSLFVGEKITADVTGPVGIAIMSKQAADAGLVSLVLFTSFLSINLGIINILPIPALDGGRIFFIIIEKLRGYPVSQKTEQVFHTTFFLLLIFLMMVVTFKDVAKLIK